MNHTREQITKTRVDEMDCELPRISITIDSSRLMDVIQCCWRVLRTAALGYYQAEVEDEVENLQSALNEYMRYHRR